MPVMHIHSTSDPIARYDGGLGPPWAFSETRMMHTAVEEMIARWTGYDSCPPKPARVEAISGQPGSLDDGHTAIKRIYGPCRDGVEIVLWQLGGAGHVWPGGIRDFNQQLLGTGTTIIDANTEMWKFFSRFRRLN
jgi:poly(3-hydroxybutyrate) depolymerase